MGSRGSKGSEYDEPLEPSSRDSLLAIALAAIVVISASTVVTFGVCGAYHDDAIYVSTAKALAEGRGYRLIDLPGAPRQTKYPALYPLLLALVWRVWPTFPDNLLAMQGLSIAIAAVAMAASFLYVVRIQRCEPLTAAFAIALCATSPTLVYYATQTLSEIPFLVALVAALWVVAAQADRTTSSATRGFVTGLTIALPAQVRMIGAAVLLPLIYRACHRRGRRFWVIVGGLLPMIGWAIWAWTGRNAASDAARYYVDYLGWWRDAGSRVFARVVLLNLLMTATATADWLPQDWKIGGVAILWPLIGLVMWAVTLRRARSAFASSMIAYVTVVLAWPWPSGRFIVPLWPLVVPISFEAMRRRVGTVAVACGCALIIAANVVALRQVASRNRMTGFPTPPAGQHQVEWKSYLELFSWVRMHTGVTDTVTAGFDSMTYLYTDRPSIRAFASNPTALFYRDRSRAPVGNDTEFLTLLRDNRPRYVVQTPMPGFAEEAPFDELLDRVQRTTPSCLKVAYRNAADQRFTVFAVDLPNCHKR